jgi:hypothetical protein
MSHIRATALLTAAACAATLTLWAQGTAPAAPAQAPPAAPPGAPGGPGGQGPGRGAANEPDFSKKPPVLALSPAEQAKKFQLQPGFKMTAVLTDPDIQESAQIAFDGNCLLFVLEIRGYMQDADATGELAPVGRVSVHEDRDNNGIYETHKVFVDNMVFPRFVMPLGKDAILTKESNADEVCTQTTTADGLPPWSVQRLRIFEPGATTAR